MLWKSDFERQAELDMVRDSGAGWVALDIDWASIQAGRFSFNWGPTDTAVIEARARGLKILGVIAYSPQWARPANCPPNDTHCLPLKAAWFGAFAREAALRYGSASTNRLTKGSIQAGQVWNEPNHYPFVQVPDPRFYVDMLRQTFVQVRSVDPWATIIAGGTAPAPDTPGRDMQPASFLDAI